MFEQDALLEESQKKVFDLEISLEEANKRAQDVSLHASALEDQVKLLKLEKSQLEAEKAEVEALRARAEAMEKAKAEVMSHREASLAREKVDLEARRRSLISRIQSKVVAFVAERERIAAEWGVAKFRVEFLSSPEGQEFLRILHQDLVADFSKSEDFVDAIKGGVSFLIGKTIRLVLAQLGDPSLKEKIDLDGFISKMRFDKLKKALGTDPQCPKAWWLASMERAGQLFVSPKESTSKLSPTSLYTLSFLSNSIVPTLAPLDEVYIQKALGLVWEGEPTLSKPTSSEIDLLEGNGVGEDEAARNVEMAPEGDDSAEAVKDVSKGGDSAEIVDGASGSKASRVEVSLIMS